ncbi:uncharacterized protein LOC106153106 [Lingula anatina]|uniref:Uncharacterized protein LOC106153106 n=1 Tax=Lingula anatina TaxID=7574 RepID=A0A1S3H8G5_LINAN|nr:uncharacterized protein LOC106153106 [Lingula anatina]|eukprot:XP_013382405.1 uncharacterized protein LOC106153106 [Lingula anatina]
MEPSMSTGDSSTWVEEEGQLSDSSGEEEFANPDTMLSEIDSELQNTEDIYRGPAVTTTRSTERAQKPSELQLENVPVPEIGNEEVIVTEPEECSDAVEVECLVKLEEPMQPGKVDHTLPRRVRTYKDCMPHKRSRSSTAPESTPSKHWANKTPPSASTSYAGPSSAPDKCPRGGKGKQLLRRPTPPSNAVASSPSTSASSPSTPPVDNQTIFNILKEMSQAMSTLAANSVPAQSGQHTVPESVPPSTASSADTGIVPPQTSSR